MKNIFLMMGWVYSEYISYRIHHRWHNNLSQRLGLLLKSWPIDSDPSNSSPTSEFQEHSYYPKSSHPTNSPFTIITFGISPSSIHATWPIRVLTSWIWSYIYPHTDYDLFLYFRQICLFLIIGPRILLKIFDQISGGLVSLALAPTQAYIPYVSTRHVSFFYRYSLVIWELSTLSRATAQVSFPYVSPRGISFFLQTNIGHLVRLVF